MEVYLGYEIESLKSPEINFYLTNLSCFDKFTETAAGYANSQSTASAVVSLLAGNMSSPCDCYKM